MHDESSSNVVLIGKKPIMNYVVACLTLFNSGKSLVIVRARGTTISRAVDTVELLRKAFIMNLEVKNISIGTQHFKTAEDVESSTSTIEIMISKPSINLGKKLHEIKGQ